MSDDKTSSDLRAQGDKIRREVLGDARVDSTTRDPDAFNAPLIDYLTKYAWGDVWSRPGLDKRSRSILNLGMLSALGRCPVQWCDEGRNTGDLPSGCRVLRSPSGT